MQRREIIRFLILRTIGNFFVLFTIFGFFATFGPALYYEASYRVGAFSGVHFRVAHLASRDTSGQEPSPLKKVLEERESLNEARGGSNGFLGAILSGQKEQILLPKSTEFSIIIPKIGASERVFANTDPASEHEYLEVLKGGIAHAKGSAFPGINGNIYLFAHSADNFWNVGRYNAVFYLLKELGSGDEVVVFFQGKRHDYVVFDKKIVDAQEVGYVNANLGKGEILTLQTCWPPGTTWKRLLVFARPRTVR